jgi:hypothetical protein
MQAAPHASLLRELGVPVFFTFFGAALGFLATMLRDECNARRDKRAFLRGVGMELDALGDQLDASLTEIKESTESVGGGGTTGPQIAASFRTGVFTTQVVKLRDVADPLLISVIHYYSDMETLQHIVEMVNGLGSEFNSSETFSGQKESVRPRLLSALIALQKQLVISGARLKKLRAKLPPAETDDT